MNPEAIIKKYNMLPIGSRVLCALSGGVDSVALTHYLAANAGKYGITVAAAHFSHGIRPDVAESEKALCIALCKSLDIPCFCGGGNSVDYAKEHKMGLEEAARKLRYDFLEKTAREWKADKIATAHHSGDNIETVIMNACRGAGVHGLSGIPAVRDKFIRPLLDISKTDIEAYAEMHGLCNATDLTNFRPCCRRNEIRLLLLPQIRRAYSDADGIISRFAMQARLADERIDCKAEKLVEACEIRENEAIIPLNLIALEDKAVSARAFEIIYKKTGGKAMLSSRHISKIFEIALGSHPSASVSLPGITACRRYDELVFCKPVLYEQLSDKIIGMDKSLVFYDWHIEIKEGIHDKAFVLDKTKITLPITVRTRKEGDRFYVNGMGKTLKKLMIERKIPKEERNYLPIFCDGENVIAAALLGADSRFKTKSAENAVSVILRRIEK